MWHSSFVTEAITPKLVSTVSGSNYQLEGKFDEERMETNGKFKWLKAWTKSMTKGTQMIAKTLVCLLSFFFAGFPPEVIRRFADGFPTGWKDILRRHFGTSSPEQRTAETDRSEDTRASSVQPPIVEQKSTKKQLVDKPSLKRKGLDEGDSALNDTPQDNSGNKGSLESNVDPSDPYPFNNGWKPKSRPGSMYVTAVEIPIFQEQERKASTNHPVGRSSDNSKLRNQTSEKGKAAVGHQSKRRSLVNTRSNDQVIQGGDSVPSADTAPNVDNSHGEVSLEDHVSNLQLGSNSPAPSLDRNEDDGVTISLADRGIVLHSQSVHSGPSSPFP